MVEPAQDADRAEILSRLLMMLPKFSTATLAGMADALEYDLIEASAQSSQRETPLLMYAPDISPPGTLAAAG